MAESPPDRLLKALQSEHDEVSEQIANLRAFWSEVNELGQGPKYEEMGSRVRNLRELLANHFACEERDGYLAPALKRAPRYTAQADQLRREHPQFLDSIDHIVNRLQSCESAYQCWQEVRTEFEDFLQRLQDHEAAEISIVEAAERNDNSTNSEVVGS